MTLKALSHLVMMLGATTVIGGKRGKLFTDGRPKSLTTISLESQTKVKDKTRESPLKINRLYDLPERPSPDGGEDNSSSATVLEGEGDNENWSDWDAATFKDSPKNHDEDTTEQPLKLTVNGSKSEEKISINKSLPDIDALDIKNYASDRQLNSEIDFFHDMEPVISKTQVLSIKSSKTKFDVESDETGSNWEGWGEDWELEEVT